MQLDLTKNGSHDKNLSPSSSVCDLTQKSLLRNLEDDFKLIDNEFLDLGLI